MFRDVNLWWWCPFLLVLIYESHCCSPLPGWQGSTVITQTTYAGVIIRGTITDLQPVASNVTVATKDKKQIVVEVEGYYKGCGPARATIVGISSLADCGPEIPPVGTVAVFFVCATSDPGVYTLHEINLFTGIVLGSLCCNLPQSSSCIVPSSTACIEPAMLACDPPPPLQHGSFIISKNSYLADKPGVGSIATFQCNTGYTFIGGPENATCLTTGQWSVNLAKLQCVIQEKNDLVPFIESVEGVGLPQPGDRITIKGLHFNGGLTGVLLNGVPTQFVVLDDNLVEVRVPPTWKNPNDLPFQYQLVVVKGDLKSNSLGPRSVGVSCPELITLQNGTVFYVAPPNVTNATVVGGLSGETVRYPVGTTARFLCDDGFLLRGTTETSCLSIGEWSIPDGVAKCVQKPSADLTILRDDTEIDDNQSENTGLIAATTAVTFGILIAVLSFIFIRAALKKRAVKRRLDNYLATGSASRKPFSRMRQKKDYEQSSETGDSYYTYQDPTMTMHMHPKDLDFEYGSSVVGAQTYLFEQTGLPSDAFSPNHYILTHYDDEHPVEAEYHQHSTLPFPLPPPGPEPVAEYDMSKPAIIVDGGVQYPRIPPPPIMPFPPPPPPFMRPPRSPLAVLGRSPSPPPHPLLRPPPPFSPPLARQFYHSPTLRDYDMY